MKVSKLIKDKALLKYISKDKIDPYDILSIQTDTEYFLIINIKEIFNTASNTKIFTVMRDNEFQGLIYYDGFCGWDCDFNLTDEGHSISC